MNSKVVIAFSATLFFGLSGAASAQGSVAGNTQASDTNPASSVSGLGQKKKSHKPMKKVNPASAKADADSVSNGASGSDAKGGE
jgi:hypothetical protein